MNEKIVTKDILKKLYQPRSADARKYDFGLLIVIGGSDFYSGSPALSALAAFRSGVDMVRIIAPKRAADIIASYSPDLASFPLEGKRLEKEHLATLISMTESAKSVANGNVAVVIGGGVGRSEETQETILEYLKEVQVPVVVDADAIHALGKAPEIISGKDFLITPHPYEFFVLTGKKIYQLSAEEKIKLVQEEAARLGTTILLKGKLDIISNGSEVVLNELNCPYLTVGGCGDTLAGICGAFLARGVNLFESAQAGAYLNVAAGILAAQEFGDGMLATDLIKFIPKTICTI